MQRAQQLQAQAQEAIKAGDTETAENLQERAIVEAVPDVPTETAKQNVQTSQGTVFSKENLVVSVTSLKLLLEEVTAQRLPHTFIDVSIPKLKQIIKMNGLTTVPGLSIHKEQNVIVRDK